jgi:hypothetical protein
MRLSSSNRKRVVVEIGFAMNLGILLVSVDARHLAPDLVFAGLEVGGVLFRGVGLI